MPLLCDNQKVKKKNNIFRSRLNVKLKWKLLHSKKEKCSQNLNFVWMRHQKSTNYCHSSILTDRILLYVLSEKTHNYHNFLNCSKTSSLTGRLVVLDVGEVNVPVHEEAADSLHGHRGLRAPTSQSLSFVLHILVCQGSSVYIHFWPFWVKTRCMLIEHSSAYLWYNRSKICPYVTAFCEVALPYQKI